MSIDSKKLARAYRSAGAEFLAYRLEKVFAKIETDADIALHNDIVAEIALIVTGEETVRGFFKDVAGILIYKDREKVKPRKRFLFRVAGKVLELAQKKG